MRQEQYNGTEGKVCILVVDDNVDAAVTMRAVLELTGFDVHMFNDPCAALAAAGRLQPCGAILDLGMPGMSGLELASHMRRECPRTLLIACTGWGTPKDRELTREAGFAHHLVKPVDWGELAAILEKLPPRCGDGPHA